MATYQVRGARLDFGDTPSAQGGTRVTGRSDGGFSVIWAASDSERSFFDGDLFGLTFRSNLTPVNATPQQLITNTGPTFAYPLNHEITALPGGGFAVVSTDNARFTEAQAASNRETAVRFYDANGNSTRGAVYVGPSGSLGEAITVLGDGSLVTSWVDANGVLQGQYLSANGALIGGNFEIARPSGDFASRPVLTAMGGQAWIATYIAQEAAVAHAVFYDNQGQRVIDQVVADNITIVQGLLVERLADGRAVVLWAESADGTAIQVRAQIYSSNGAKFGGETVVSTSTSSITSLTALADGGFVVALEPQVTGPLQLKVFNSIGQQSGSTLTVNDAIEPDVAALSDGGFVLTWKQASTGQFHAQAYAATATGALNLAGTAGADVLVGQEGNDTIQGLGGADQLFGSVGNDTLDGGLANDSLDGGAGNDRLTGGGGADVLTGGLGADTIIGTRADLSGDRIEGFGTDDRLVFADASLASFSFARNGDVVSYGSGQSLTVAGLTSGLKARAAAEGGVELFIGTAVKGDLNGDGRADILWRNDNGALTNWLGQSNGGFAGNDANGLFNGIPTSFKVVEVADFNGDGRNDILWRNDDGTLTNWLGQANGGFAGNDAAARTVVPTDWKVARAGDFNGDGRSDILWRNDNGAMTSWLGRADGGFVGNDAAARFDNIPTSWKIAGVGDFNGDARDDILWRNDNGALTNWLGRSDGGFVGNDAAALFNVPTSWKVAGVGDFNGDSRDDILWRNDNGALTNWLGRADGGFVGNDAAALFNVPTSWKVASVSDFNGDGNDDVLWRNDNGALTNWLGRDDGGFVGNDAAAAFQIPVEWRVQPASFTIA